MAGTEEGKSANRKTDLAVTYWVSGANLLLRWIPGVFITPGTCHIFQPINHLKSKLIEKCALPAQDIEDKIMKI